MIVKEIEVLVFDVGGKANWVELPESKVEEGEVIRLDGKTLIAGPGLKENREIDLKGQVGSDEALSTYWKIRGEGKIKVQRITKALHELKGGRNDSGDPGRRVIAKDRYIVGNGMWMNIVMPEEEKTKPPTPREESA